MFVALRDIAKEEFNQLITNDNCKMIGDTWHDKEAAESFGIDFIEASIIHN
jgi:phosphoglycolate phosphatase-like HAD superfamily hydrolase|tara:strand:+ start:191 stop:343 length:153 start_codon:yes stop_codon:yes gene_type:complete